MVFSRSKATPDQHQCGLTHLSSRDLQESSTNLVLSATKYCLLKQQLNSILSSFASSGAESWGVVAQYLVTVSNVFPRGFRLQSIPCATARTNTHESFHILLCLTLTQVCKHSCADLRILGPRALSLGHHCRSDVSIGEMR